MLEGTTGVQVAATHERILFYTCPRVQPHEEIAASVRVVGPRFIWTSFPRELAELSGLTALLHDPERASHAGRGQRAGLYTANNIWGLGTVNMG